MVLFLLLALSEETSLPNQLKPYIEAAAVIVVLYFPCEN